MLSLHVDNCCSQKYSRLWHLLLVKGLVACFYLGWSCSILLFRQNIVNAGSKSLLLTCSSNITLSLPSYISTDGFSMTQFSVMVMSLTNDSVDSTADPNPIPLWRDSVPNGRIYNGLAKFYDIDFQRLEHKKTCFFLLKTMVKK